MPFNFVMKVTSGLCLLSKRKLKLPLPFLANAYYFHKKGYRFATGGLPSNDFPVFGKVPVPYADDLPFGLYPSQHGAVVSVACSRLFVNMHSNTFIDPRFDQKDIKMAALSYNFLTYVDLKSRIVFSRHSSAQPQNDLWVYQNYMPTPLYVYIKNKAPLRRKHKWKGIKVVQGIFERYFSKKDFFKQLGFGYKKIVKRLRKRSRFFKYWLRMNDYLKWFSFYPKKKPFYSFLKFINKRDPNFFSHLYSIQDYGTINTRLKSKNKIFLKTAFPLLTKLLRSYYVPNFIEQAGKQLKKYNDFLYSHLKIKNFYVFTKCTYIL